MSIIIIFYLSVASNFTIENVTFVLNGSNYNPCYTGSITDNDHFERRQLFLLRLDSTDDSVIIENPTTRVAIFNDDGMEYIGIIGNILFVCS